MRPASAAVLTISLLCGATAAATQTCRQALALGLDVSGSVDAHEYRLQLDGLATALGSPAVRAALFSTPDAVVDILVYEWSGPGDQHLLLDWTSLALSEDIAAVQATLGQTTRRSAAPGTALGNAMEIGLAYLEQRKGCWRRTLDISGDGKANLGPEPRQVRRQFEAENVTLNALVIGADAPRQGDLRAADIAELTAYFQTQVISGTDAFVQTAVGFGEYAQAMERKLVRELATLVVSQAD